MKFRVLNFGGRVVIREDVRHLEAAYRAQKLLRGLANTLKDLWVSHDTLHVLTYAEELAAHLPLFHNLNNIEVFDEPMDSACRGLLNILQNSPHLESLHFLERICLSKHAEEHDRIFDPVPACFLTHLKTVKICFFDESEEVLHVVKSLLETATGLEKLWLQSSGGKRIYDLLSAHSEGLMNCKIAFYC
ncbi:uncharacterized protein LOC111278260 isoform X2 [Durio zibethinus]|uniref:Uncharacterized protein LOC111278260 isoform X2 n=1 Tax=Durio zibethinus TaxID=66656 RepID=A0A6P5WWX1_DURZI|nr:uncharacterized protein LOC111278260 isoform X2 [Durio zibethinus]